MKILQKALAILLIQSFVLPAPLLWGMQRPTPTYFQEVDLEMGLSQPQQPQPTTQGGPWFPRVSQAWQYCAERVGYYVQAPPPELTEAEMFGPPAIYAVAAQWTTAQQPPVFGAYPALPAGTTYWVTGPVAQESEPPRRASELTGRETLSDLLRMRKAKMNRRSKKFKKIVKPLLKKLDAVATETKKAKEASDKRIRNWDLGLGLLGGVSIAIYGFSFYSSTQNCAAIFANVTNVSPPPYWTAKQQCISDAFGYYVAPIPLAASVILGVIFKAREQAKELNRALQFLVDRNDSQKDLDGEYAKLKDTFKDYQQNDIELFKLIENYSKLSPTSELDSPETLLEKMRQIYFISKDYLEAFNQLPEVKESLAGLLVQHYADPSGAPHLTLSYTGPRELLNQKNAKHALIQVLTSSTFKGTRRHFREQLILRLGKAREEIAIDNKGKRPEDRRRQLRGDIFGTAFDKVDSEEQFDFLDKLLTVTSKIALDQAAAAAVYKEFEELTFSTEGVTFPEEFQSQKELEKIVGKLKELGEQLNLHHISGMIFTDFISAYEDYCSVPPSTEIAPQDLR